MGQHNIRADDALWDAASAKARAEGRTVTDVIAAALREYVAEADTGGSLRPVRAKDRNRSAAPELVLPPPKARAATGRYACCKHCRREHGGHSDPCTQGCR